MTDETILLAAQAHADEHEVEHPYGCDCGQECDGKAAAKPLPAAGGIRWIERAEDLRPRGSSGTPQGGAPKVVWHTTEGADFATMHRVLTEKRAEPHILYDPTNDRMGQYFPLDRTARALRPGVGVSKNQDGLVVIQIEVCAFAARPFTRTWRPGPNFAALLAALRSWGVPDVWPSGRLASHGEDVSRSRTTWARAGHFGHCNVPDNTHWDPGAIDKDALLGAGGDWFDMASEADLRRIVKEEVGDIAADAVRQLLAEHLNTEEPGGMPLFRGVTVRGALKAAAAEELRRRGDDSGKA